MIRLTLCAARLLPIDMDFASKKEAREQLLAKRLAITPELKQWRDTELCKSIARLHEFMEADTLLLYSPVRGEPDITPLAFLAWTLKKAVAFPISNTATLTLTFKEVSSLSELRVGAYGILEPDIKAKNAKMTKKTLCIVPALSFDMHGFRLGYGKGFYDRFLADFSGVSVGAIYDSLISRELPTNGTDIPAHIVISETGVLYTNEILQKERGYR